MGLRVQGFLEEPILFDTVALPIKPRADVGGESGPRSELLDEVASPTKDIPKSRNFSYGEFDHV